MIRAVPKGSKQASRPEDTVTPQAATIVVVEDDPGVSEAVAAILTAEGYHVVCAGHGGEALEYLRHHAAPALVLLDLFMPIMNGWELLKEIDKDPGLSRIPVIVVTAADQHWGHPVRPRMLLRKPVEMSQLLAMVREATRAS